MFTESAPAATSRGHLAILLCVAGALIAAALFSPVRAWLAHGKHSPTEFAEAKLSLQAAVEGERMRVVWDRNAPILREADSGVLSIRDGSFLRNFPLTSRQLRDPNDIIYSPSTSEVELKLEVRGSKIAKQSQSVLVVLGPRQDPDAVATRPPIDAEVVDEPQPKSVPAPPAVAARLIPAVIIKRETGQGIRSGSYRPPHPLGEIRATIPGQAQPLIRGPVEIDVRVAIDARGKVVEAKPVSQTGSFSGLPAQQALITRALLNAASNSSFQPAQINSQAVPSELTLGFRLTPK
jgi:hypothetical protein